MNKIYTCILENAENALFKYLSLDYRKKGIYTTGILKKITKMHV